MMKLLLLSVITIFHFSHGTKAPKEFLTVRFVEAHDGDTIRVVPYQHDVKQFRVRFAYLDSPELAQQFGPEARDFLIGRLLHGSNVGNISLNLEIYHDDNHGRKLAVVKQNGMDINFWMVEHGYAWCYRNRCPQNYKQAMKAAQKAKKGLWSQDNPLAPWVWRRRYMKGRKRHFGK